MSEVDAEDDAAFMQSLTKHQRDIRAFIIGVTPTISDADDILQEVNLALWKKRQQYDRNQVFIRWAFAFAVTEVRNFRNRSAKTKLWFNDDVLEMVAEAYPHDSQLVEQRRDALTSCVQKLGTVERQFITDFYRNECSAQDLANASGKPVSTVYKTLTRARESLRTCIERTLARQSRPA